MCSNFANREERRKGAQYTKLCNNYCTVQYSAIRRGHVLPREKRWRIDDSKAFSRTGKKHYRTVMSCSQPGGNTALKNYTFRDLCLAFDYLSGIADASHRFHLKTRFRSIRQCCVIKIWLNKFHLGKTDTTVTGIVRRFQKFRNLHRRSIQKVASFKISES